MSNAAIANAIRNSGLTPTEVKAKLQQAGFDPSLADPFFGGVPGTARVDPATVQAMTSIGIDLGSANDTGTNTDETRPTDENARNADSLTAQPGAFRVFGRDIFSSRSSAFDPAIAGPVDAGYRIGIGDALQIVLTGQVEQVYQAEVRRDGTVLLPSVGFTPIAGLTLDAARAALRSRAARVYSGLDDGKTTLDLSVNRVRTNQVFVIGDVERPGSYSVNGLATTFHAIARAGGPTVRGSFRNIELRRGGTIVKHIDLYAYLVKGDASADVRTEQGDVIFVPPATRSIALRGAVRREGIYELRDTEGFKDLLFYAGGLLPTAATNRIQIDRTLPPDLRSPGVDRVVVDVPVGPKMATLDTLHLYDNDIINVFQIGELRRNTVEVAGEVFQPGIYEWTPGLTLGQLLTRAEGLLPWAASDRVKIERRIPNVGQMGLTSVNVGDSAGLAFPLQEFDQVNILDSRSSPELNKVVVLGAVRAPQTITWSQHLTLGDAIDIVRGLQPSAQVIEVARRKKGTAYSDTSAVLQSFTLGAVPDAIWRSYALNPEDRVSVRTSPGFRNLGTVTVTGAFTHPGSYVITTDEERLSSVIRRAGGALPTAYGGSLNVIRNGRPVPIEYDRVVSGKPTDDIVLADGDQIRIDKLSNVVNVGGAVERPASVPYRAGWSLHDYVDAAGGYSLQANKRSIIVTYASGKVAREKHHFWLTESPPVAPGATITVGAVDPNETKTDASKILTTTAQTAVTVMSLIISYLAVKR